MPDNPIRFDGGINRLEGASLNTIYDINNAYIDPLDEIRAWRTGTFANTSHRFIPRRQPSTKFSERWYDSTYMDDFGRYRNRLYMSKILDLFNGNFESWTTQVFDDPIGGNLNTFNEIQSTNLSPLVMLGSSYAAFSTNRTVIQVGILPGFTNGVKGWAADDPGIEGITVGRAVDYVFVPIDKFGQAGPWKFTTVYVDLDTSGAEQISGTAIFTVVPTFNLGIIGDDFFGSSLAYKEVLVYRSIEYDLNADSQSGSPTATDSVTGGLFFEDTAPSSIYTSRSYWPFNIQREDSGLSDQLGPVIDRSRNHWNDNFAGVLQNQLGAKAVHNDAGVMIYGNIATPTKTPIVSHQQTNADVTIDVTFNDLNPDTLTRTVGSWITDGFSVGDKIYIEGATALANNKKLTIDSLTATTITLPTAEGITAEGPTSVRVWNAPPTSYQHIYNLENGTDILDDTEPSSLINRAIYNAARTVFPWKGESKLRTYVQRTGPLTSIDGVANTISLQGDWTSFFADDGTIKKFKIAGTSSNDGTYTIDTSSVSDVFVSTGGTMTFASTSGNDGTLTRSIGSWITDGYGVGTNFDFACLCLQIGSYTVNSATATVLNVTRIGGPVDAGVVSNYTIFGNAISFTGGSSIVPVVETVTTEGAGGTYEFYMIWEELGIDSNGRYVSKKQPASEYYTFNSKHDETSFFNAGDYHNREVFSDIPAGNSHVRERSAAYLSAQNAPWEITFNGFSIPDGSKIRAITPTRIEEVEQLTAYGFYVFTDTTIYVGNRIGNDVRLTAIESTTGLDVTGGGQNDLIPLVTPVKAGVVFHGKDKNLYYLTGRQLTKIDFPLQDIYLSVFGIMYDSKEDNLYLATDTGVWIYNFDRGMWIGQYSAFNNRQNFEAELFFNERLDGTEIVGDQIGSTINISDTYTLTQADFEFFAERTRTADTAWKLDLIRNDGVADETIAIINQPNNTADSANNWTVSGGTLFSGNVTLDPGDSVRLEINTLPNILFAAEYRFIVKGLEATGPTGFTLSSIHYDTQFLYPIYVYTTINGGLFIYEEVRGQDTGEPIIEGAYVETQNFRNVLTQEIEGIKVDYDGIKYTGRGNYTTGSSLVTNDLSLDEFDATRDKLAAIELKTGGQGGNPLVTWIDSIIGDDANLVDNARTGDTSVIYDWRPSADVEVFLLGIGIFRDRNLGPFRTRPNRTIYPHNSENHDMRVRVTNFERLRQLLIFTKNTLESD